MSLKSIGETSKLCEVTTVQLRDWEKNGLITCHRKSNGRYFDETEFDRICKVRDLFEEARELGTKRTYEDVRRELFGEALVQKADAADQQKRMEAMMQTAFDTVFDDDLKGIFLRLAEGYKALQDRNETLERDLGEIKKLISEQSLSKEVAEMKEVLHEIRQSVQSEAAATLESMAQMKDELTERLGESHRELPETVDEAEESNGGEALSETPEESSGIEQQEAEPAAESESDEAEGVSEQEAESETAPEETQNEDEESSASVEESEAQDDESAGTDASASTEADTHQTDSSTVGAQESAPEEQSESATEPKKRPWWKFGR